MRVDIFSIPVWYFDVPNFQEHQKDIIKAVRKIRRNDKGGQFSNIKGYQSTLSSEYAHIPQFNPIFSFLSKVCVPEVLNDLDLEVHNRDFIAWANVNDEKNAFNTLHNHTKTDSNILFSGVCYIKSPPNSGRIEFRNGISNNLWPALHYMKKMNRYTAQSFTFKPVEGKLLIWPSFVWHMVYPNEHNQERISIAFDVHTKRKNDEKSM